METIEFGGVLVRMSDLQPIDERSWFIKPKVHPVLSDYCTNLTSITQDQVDAGLRFEEVCELIVAWLEPHRERLGWAAGGTTTSISCRSMRGGTACSRRSSRTRTPTSRSPSRTDTSLANRSQACARPLSCAALRSKVRIIAASRKIVRMLPLTLDSKLKVKKPSGNAARGA